MSICRTINLAAGANTQLWGVITNEAGEDITGATFEVALVEGTPADADWVTPDDTDPIGLTKMRLMLRVGGTFEPEDGTYIYWGRVTSAPDVEPVRLGLVRIVAAA